ncbi:Trp biosynthesis-associated membrane protein [Sciscionella sediminilitoris]|uniref:Trp biosynthesis-associated membrane protein n=1 Tax=Sciscionella sediminilitoris TaxID=1445613 RepID=UPI0004DFAFDC|nr:Trp biosynthesis-associated membrane protein [Sciscionella sp. SE31]
MTDRRPGRSALWALLLCLLLAAALLWGSSRLGWSAGSAPVRGSEAVPELVPLALLALAALAAQFAGGAPVKRIIGVLVLISGCYLAYRGITGAAPFAPGPGSTAPSDQDVLARSLVGLAALAELGAAAALLSAARVLPAMGARYTRGAGRQRAKAPDQRMWDALSEGEDPTTK